ncbi:MAG: sugar-transfer associated ATP-grasp domain-containing protein [Steroidobacteraceae bacterium]
MAQQWREARALRAKYRCFPYHYLKHRLYERSARTDFLDYLPARLVRHFRRLHNPRSQMHLLNDKQETTRIVGSAGIRCVETLLSIQADGTIRRGDGANAEPGAAAEVLRRQGGDLFVKPIDSRAGLGAFRIAAASIDTAWVGSMRNVLIQPALRNHPLIDSLYAGSLNTLRMVTFVEEGRCVLIACCLKMGRGKTVVDNYNQGGIAVAINLESGTLVRTGSTKTNHGGSLFEAHPDTGVPFASITLPWWRETIDLAGGTALSLRPHVVLGLDIALAPEGPVFIEANGAADMFSIQEVCGPLGNTLLGQRVLAHWLESRR